MTTHDEVHGQSEPTSLFEVRVVCLRSNQNGSVPLANRCVLVTARSTRAKHSLGPCVILERPLPRADEKHT